MSAHRISWFEIPAGDIQRAKQFYETIFQLEMEDLHLGDQVKMALFPHGQTDIGGALVWNEDFYHPSEQGPLLYLNANPDLAEAEARVAGAGGKVLISKRMISPDHGYMAVIRDTEGNRVALHSDK